MTRQSFWAMNMSKKSILGQSCRVWKWRGKIGQNALMVALFKQLPQTQIRPPSKYFGAHLIANDKTIILSTENVQKVHSRPKLFWTPTCFYNEDVSFRQVLLEINQIIKIRKLFGHKLCPSSAILLATSYLTINCLLFPPYVFLGSLKLSSLVATGKSGWRKDSHVNICQVNK